MSELRTNRIIPRDGLPSGSSGGIIQVKQAVKTDSSFNTSSTSFTDITGLSVSITPTRSDSKILIFMDVKIGTDTNYVSGYVRMVRDSTPIYIGDDAGTSATRATAGMADDPNNQFPYQMTGQFLDSPATTSAVTYQVGCIPGTTTAHIYINRSERDYSGTGYDYRAVSNITAWEVSG